MPVIITEDTLKRHKRKKNETDEEYSARVSGLRAVAKYKKKYIKQVKIELNVKTDSDLIDFYNFIPDIYGTSKASFFKDIMQNEYNKYQDVIRNLKIENSKKK
jgi:hypothetical protein